MHNVATAEAAEDRLEISLTEKGTDVYYLPAKVGDNATELLFDTGSGYLALNKGLIQSLEADGKATYQRSVRARVATGATKEVSIYTISDLDLGGGCVIRDVEAAMLGAGSRNILGMNVLKRVDSFSLSTRSSTLVLNGCAAEQHITSL